jgi:hypothetical protein
LPLIFRVQFKISLEEMRHMSLFGCRPAAIVVQPGMGTASRAAAVVHQYGYFRRPDCFCFSQRSPAGAWMLADPTIYVAARSLHGTTSDRLIPQSSSAKKMSDIEFSEKFGILEKYHGSNMQLKMHGF